MKKIFIFTIACFFSAILFFHSTHSMAENPRDISNCPGEIVVNVTHTVTNDVDPRASGSGVWAIDNYERHLRVWQAFPSVNVYCAKVEYKGFFTTLAGESPQGTDSNLAAGINGVMQGGYKTNYFNGTLNPNPDKPRRGNLGNINYRCRPNDPGDRSSCTNLWVWQNSYFNSITWLDPNPDHRYLWWGWAYDGDDNGIWMNICGGRGMLCPGNSGDITD